MSDHVIIIGANEALNQENAWLIDFFDQQKSLGTSYWPANKPFQFIDKDGNVIQFSFSMPVYARPKHKNSNQFVYEMLDRQACLGNGRYGYVYNIPVTIGRDHQQQFRARNKVRVGKLTSTQKEALDEFERAQDIDYLHVKKPLNGLMVMKRLQGSSLDKFLRENNLTRVQAWKLTHALALAVKRLADKGIEHHDAHDRNIMIQEKQVNGETTYKLKIIDFAYSETPCDYNETSPSTDFFTFFQYVYPKLWDKQTHIPFYIDVLKENTLPIKQILLGFSLYAISPMPEAQEMLDQYYLYLTKLNKQYPVMAKTLRTDMKTAIKQSTSSNIEAMRDVIFSAHARIQESCPNAPAFPLICFDSDPAKQQAFNKILHCHQKLNLQAVKLGKASFDAMCDELKEKTLAACYADLKTPGEKAKRAMELTQCNAAWQQQLSTHSKDIHHVEGKRILAEIGTALACLIVLYPVALAINYKMTKRIGLFCHSIAEKIPAKVEQPFSVLCN